jgi:hypothetical protein
METDKTIGIAAPMLLHQDGTFQLSYGNYPSFINELRMKRDATLIREIPRTRSPKQVEWVSFAAVMVRKSAYESIHGFDERYFLYFEDADFCYRMQQNGYKTFYCAEYSLIHTRGGSWSDAVVHGIKIEYRRSQIIFYQSHRSMYESIALRIFLVCRCMVLFLVNSGEYRTRALSTMKLALFYHANRS